MLHLHLPAAAAPCSAPAGVLANLRTQPRALCACVTSQPACLHLPAGSECRRAAASDGLPPPPPAGDALWRSPLPSQPGALHCTALHLAALACKLVCSPVNADLRAYKGSTRSIYPHPHPHPHLQHSLPCYCFVRVPYLMPAGLAALAAGGVPPPAVSAVPSHGAGARGGGGGPVATVIAAFLIAALHAGSNNRPRAPRAWPCL